MNEWTQEFIAEVESLAEPVVRFEGMELIDVEFHRGPGGWVLRVFIDKEEGVTLEDCAAVSHQLGDVLDAKLERDEPYHLEVSSPGLDRPLTKPKHFAAFEGRPAIIRTNRPVEGKKKFRGVLAGLSDDTVKLVVDELTVSIPYEAIAKAKLDALKIEH
jgi:ribosome maturation factor RimP